MKKFIGATGILAASSGVAFAHPGEHHFPIINTLIHLLTEPDHLAMMALAVVVAAAVVYKRKRRAV